jgi:hypothetical protein
MRYRIPPKLNMAGLSDSIVGIEGLGNAGRITVIALTASAWTALPTTPLTARASVFVQNQSGNGNVVLLNYSNTAGSGEGIQVADGGYKGASINGSVTLYGRMASGTGTVAVEELA